MTRCTIRFARTDATAAGKFYLDPVPVERGVLAQLTLAAAAGIIAPTGEVFMRPAIDMAIAVIEASWPLGWRNWLRQFSPGFYTG